MIRGYGQCGAQGGYTGAKITYGRIPEWGRFLVVPLRLGDYAEGDWFFLAICGTCGREAILEPTEILARAGTGNVHGGMHLSDLEALLRCRDCLSRRARLEPVARIRKQNFVAGMI